MAEWADDHDQAASLSLDPVLDIKAVSLLAENLLARRGSDIVINAGQVERFGAQSLQVLLSAVATWRADGHLLEFANPSETFIEGLRVFGVDAESWLQHPHVAG
ncbi:MAG: STAS domain-containing protein [Methylovirgula sp.]|uniref:STAS domain-containing protein n=1 Tax=Methylovirgula sp. TaxID=1978224 RepID=UPI0030767A9E